MPDDKNNGNNGQPPKNKGGRPISAISDAQVGLICKAITETFCFPFAAAITSGVSQTSYYYWKTRGEKDLKDGVDSPYARFWEQVLRADREAERSGARSLRILAVDLVKEVETTVKKKDGTEVTTKKPVLLRPGSANAAIALMEKRWRKDGWGRVEKVEQVESAEVTEARLAEMARKVGVSPEEFKGEYQRLYGRTLVVIDSADSNSAAQSAEPVVN